jgi:hypothetical protein
MWRVMAAVLVTISAVSQPAVLALVVLATDPPITPPILVQLVALFTVAPLVAARWIRRAFLVRIDVSGDHIALRRHDLQVEIPDASIARMAAWAVPLPGPGFSLWLRSGRRFRYGVQLADPGSVLVALSERSVAAARSIRSHPTNAYALARAAGAPWRWYHLVAKFPVFALVPTLVLFRAHQYIAYGGLLGEYYLLGLGAYFRTFAVYWLTLTIYQVLYAGTWRVLAEIACWLSAWWAADHAATVRRAAEISCRVLYYGGVPTILAFRFLP